jgi:hypothetical protein
VSVTSTTRRTSNASRKMGWSGIGLTTVVTRRRPRFALVAVQSAGSETGEFAGLDCFVELALGDGDGHAGIAVGVLRSADLRRRNVVVLLRCFDSRGCLVSSEPAEDHCCESCGLSDSR